MSWRFRHSFKVLPGLKLNVSKTGLSASIGGAPFTLNLGQKGLYATASIPGTGISHRQRLLSVPADRNNYSTNPSPAFHTPGLPAPGTQQFPSPQSRNPSFTSPSLHEIESASTERLTSESLVKIKNLIQTAQIEREDICHEIAQAKEQQAIAAKRFNDWDHGFFLKRVRKEAFAVRRNEADNATAKVLELEEQLRQTVISTKIELDTEQAEPFFKMRDCFTALAECAAIWDVTAEGDTDRVRERTLANKRVNRQRVRFTLSGCDLIRWEQKVPHLENANGGEMFLYPGFILYRKSKSAFSVLDLHDVDLSPARVAFHEEQGVPSDSQIVGHTWAKTNKDGTRDRRFANNYQIPIVQYGELTLKSTTGLWEAYHFSNPARLEQFVKSWTAFAGAVGTGISIAVHDDSDNSAD